MFTNRYHAFARSQGRSAEEQRAHDREEWPQGSAAPFMLWIGEQWRAFFAERGEKRPASLWPHHHEAFDKWLDARFSVEVKT